MLAHSVASGLFKIQALGHIEAFVPIKVGSYSQTGLGDANGDLLEADLSPGINSGQPVNRRDRSQPLKSADKGFLIWSSVTS